MIGFFSHLTITHLGPSWSHLENDMMMIAKICHSKSNFLLFIFHRYYLISQSNVNYGIFEKFGELE